MRSCWRECDGWYATSRCDSAARRDSRGDVPFGEWQARWRVDAALEKLGAGATHPAGPDRSRIERSGVEAHLSWQSGVGRP